MTVLADGTHGVLSTQFAEQFGAGVNRRSIRSGIKAVVQFPGENPFGNNRVVHTLGYPVRGRLRRRLHVQPGREAAAVGLILGLDWRYGDLNPQREFETFRSHPFIAGCWRAR